MDYKVEFKWLTSRRNAPDQVEVFIDGVCSCLCLVYHNGKADVMVVDDVKTEIEYQTQGFGTILLNHVIGLAKDWKIDSIELVVGRDNGIAKRLYENVGFKKTEKEHYRIILNKLL